MRRVNFNDGEGIAYEDLLMVGQLGERSAYRAFCAQIQTALEEAGVDEPMLVRGSDPTHSGTGTRTITLTNGLWCQAADIPLEIGDTPEIYFGDSVGAAYTLDANTSGAVYRRDILQAKINAESTAVPETRDFKDAVTGVVTTTSFNKRRVRTMTLSVKKGVDQVSEAAADAAEPAADAGYVKIFSFLVDNAGACAAAKRKRYTIGAFRRKLVMTAATGLTASGTVTRGATPNVANLTDATAAVWVPFQVAVGKRIRRVTARVDPDTGDTVRVRLYRSVMDSPSVAVFTLTSTGTSIQTLDSGEIDELVGTVAGASYVIEVDLSAFTTSSGVGEITVTED